MNNYTEEQLNVIEASSESNLVINSCAGSGKTTVLLERSAIISKNNISHKIQLLLTTNNSVVKENRERVTHKDLSIETFHSFIISEILPFKNNNEFDVNFNEKVNTYEEWKNRFEKNNEVRGTANNKADYLLEYGNSLLEENNIQKYLQARYSHLFVDECQDNCINKHYIIIKLISLGLNCMLVGDVNQNLYSWASGDINLFKSFFKRQDFIYMELTRNFRCHENIDRYANDCVNNNQVLNSPYLEVVIVDDNLSNIIANSDETRIFKRSNPDCKKLAANEGITYLKKPTISDYFEYEFEVFLYEYFNTKNPHKIIDTLNIEATRRNINIITNALDNSANISTELISVLIDYNEESAEYSTYLRDSVQDEDVITYFTYNPHTVSTIHFAKGLEYKNVILFESDFNMFKQDDRSLFYVACTRAKEKLYVVKNNRKFDFSF